MENRYNIKHINDKILSMILPITVENILQMTAGVVSMAFVGRINALAVGAIGMSNILFRIIWSVFKGLGTGTSVHVAQNFGAKNNEKLKSVSEQGLILAILLSIILQQILYWNAENLLMVFNSSVELLSGGTMYLKIISWSLPFAAIILLVAGILQGMGNAKTPMVVISILNIINVVFSYLLIFGKFGFPALGLKGAAYAYNISYIIAALVGLYALFNKEGELKKIEGKFSKRFKFRESMDLLKFGLPTSFETAFWQLASIFITRAILTYGETAYAAYQLGLQAESISYMPATGFAIAATTFIGQSLGSKDGELGRVYLKQLQKLTTIFTIIASLILILLPKLIMRGLTDDIEVINIGSMYILLMGLIQMPQNLNGIYNGALRGAGFPSAPMINAGVGLWLIRLPFVLFVTYVMKASITWVWIGIAIDMVGRYSLSLIMFKRKDIFNIENPIQ